MEIQYIDYGNLKPMCRAYSNDAGIDVFAHLDNPITIKPNEIVKIPLGFGLVLPVGACGLIMPRSSMTLHNLDCKLAPIDSGYRGEIHSIIQNCNDYEYLICPGESVGQLVIFNISLPTLTKDMSHERGTNNFGSSDKWRS